MDIDLPPIIDDENDNVAVEYDFGSLESYITSTPSNDKIIASPGANFDFMPTGTNMVIITLTDDNASPLSSQYAIVVTIDPAPVEPELCEDGSQPPCLPGTLTTDTGEVSDFSNTGEIIFNFDTDRLTDVLGLRSRRVLSDMPDDPILNLAQVGSHREHHRDL